MMRFAKNWFGQNEITETSHYSGSLKEKLKLAIEPEHHSFLNLLRIR